MLGVRVSRPKQKGNGVDNLRRSGDEDAMVRQGQAESSGGSATPEGEITQIRSLIGLRTAEPRVSIVIPAKNEVRNLPHVFAHLPRNDYEVILVDGDSTDDTVSEAQRLRPDITVIRQNV